MYNMDQFNLLDLDNVLNKIGDYVKKDNFKRELMKKEQTLKGKRIRFSSFNYSIIIVIHIYYMTKMEMI
jgi:hypothetical protein